MQRTRRDSGAERENGGQYPNFYKIMILASIAYLVYQAMTHNESALAGPDTLSTVTRRLGLGRPGVGPVRRHPAVTVAAVNHFRKRQASKRSQKRGMLRGPATGALGKEASLESIDEVVQESTQVGGVLARRDPLKDFSVDEKRIIALATLQPNTLPVGSFQYKAHRYPSDIDIMERYNVCCTVNKTRFTFVKDLQRLVQRAQREKAVYIGDFKAGYDTRFDVYLGDLRANTVTHQEEVIDYDPAYVRGHLEDLHNQGLITDRERAELESLVVENPSAKQWAALFDAIRSYRLLRWTPAEILKGEKALPNNKRLLLVDAVMQHSTVKVDLWAQKDGHFIEASNWFLLTAEDDRGMTQVLTGDLGNYVDNLRHDIEKYTLVKPKHLKAAKRSWSMAIAVGDLEFLRTIAPLFSTLQAFLYQLDSDASLLLTMLDAKQPIEFQEIVQSACTLPPRFNAFTATLPVNAEIIALRPAFNALAAFCASKASKRSTSFSASLKVSLHLQQTATADETGSRHGLKTLLSNLISVLQPSVEQLTVAWLNERGIDLNAWADSHETPLTCGSGV